MHVVYNKNTVRSNTQPWESRACNFVKAAFPHATVCSPCTPPCLVSMGEKFDTTVPVTSIESLRTNQSCVAFATFKKYRTWPF